MNIMAVIWTTFSAFDIKQDIRKLEGIHQRVKED